jgi:hypothetical protein
MHVKQSGEIDAEALKLQASNPSIVLQFDATQHSLVPPNSQAQRVAAYHSACKILQAE